MAHCDTNGTPPRKESFQGENATQPSRNTDLRRPDTRRRTSKRNSSGRSTSRDSEDTWESRKRLPNYDFPGLRNIVKDVVSKCQVCAKTKAPRHKPYGLLQPLPVAERPWSSVTMDFITKLPLSTDPTTGTKYDSILTVVDRLTKWTYFFPYKESWSAEQLADVIYRNVAAVHAWPEE